MEKTQVRACIDLHGDVLRYVVLERRSGAFTLRRMGSCDFDFALDEELEATRHGHLDLVKDALGHVLDEEDLSHVTVTLHPPTSFSFQTPLPQQMSEKARVRHLKQEASLLLGMMPSDDVYVQPSLLRSDIGLHDEPIDWMHVTALQAPHHWRLSQMIKALPVAGFSVQSSMQAVARLFTAAPAREVNGNSPLMLMIGWYETHAEYVVVHADGWHHDVFGDAAAPEDCAYLSASLLHRLRLDPADVGRIFLYGHQVESGAFEQLRTVFGRGAEVLDPIALLHVDASEAESPFTPSAFAPCFGAAV